MNKLSVLKARLQAVNGKNRERESRRKFYIGLYAEHSGIAFKNNGYIEEDDLLNIIEKTYNLIDNPEKEHLLYQLGVTILKEKKPSPLLEDIKSLFKSETEFQKFRFHSLVKIGAVIENKGLTKINKASMTGAFKYIATHKKIT